VDLHHLLFAGLYRRTRNRVLHRFSLLPGLISSSPSKQKASRVNSLHCAISSEVAL
jgi:hypothetical protein